jgi:hypothetical protein
MAGVFCDSFAHYDTALIPLKYSTAGGSIQSDLAHVRTIQTAPALSQSLEIQAGDAPSIINFTLPADITQAYSFANQYYTFSVGMAWQAGALNGHLFDLWRNLTVAPTPPELLLYIVLNADGSLSLFTDGGTLLGSSAAGVITAGTFYYITLSADIGGFSESTFATVNVTDSSNVSTDVISVSAFVLADQFIDSIVFGGPASPDHAWVNDFYVQDLSDGSAVPLAPNIYACLPDAVGTALSLWDFLTVGPWQPNLNDFSLINSVPPDESTGIQWNLGYLAGQQTAEAAETYNFGCAGLPDGRSIDFLQVLLLYEYQLQLLPPISTILYPAIFFQENSDGTAWSGAYGGPNIPPGTPFVYIPFPNTVDPVVGNPWTIADWKAGVWQAGPQATAPF